MPEVPTFFNYNSKDIYSAEVSQQHILGTLSVCQILEVTGLEGHELDHRTVESLLMFLV